MDSPAPTSQTYIHGDLKFVSNNFVDILEKSDVPEAFHMIQDFLATSPIGYALTNPACISAKTVEYIWKNSSVGDDGIIVFTHGANTFHITRDVIVKALRLPEGSSNVTSFSEVAMREFLTQCEYSGDMSRMGRLSRTKLRKEWNFFFDCIGRCFTNKCSNYDALNQFVQHIGYSLIHNVNFDIASNILEYLGLRIVDGHTVYFARFVDLIFKHLCPNVVFADDVLLPVFQLNPRVFKDMIGTENRLQFVGDVNLPPQVRQLLQERMPTMYGLPGGVVVQEREEENPP